MRIYHLYCIRLPVDDYAIAYIGMSKRIKSRFISHRYGRALLGRAIRECGHENVIIQKLATGDRRYIVSLERRGIFKFGTLWPRGYNRSPGNFTRIEPKPSPLVSPAMLIKAGRLLYGSSWRSKLATALKIADATLYRWKRGGSDIPNPVQGKLAELCQRQAAVLSKTAAELRQ